MERLTVIQASMIQPLVRVLVSIGLVLSLVGLSPSAGHVAAADVPLVLHDCLLVFRYGNDAHYGVTLRGSEARDINNLGEIVGWTATETGAIRATLWSDGEQTDLGTLGGENSCALGINDAGQVVGWAETEEAEPHAVRWENGVPTDLGALPGEISVAFAINELGQAAGLSWPVAVQVVFPVGRAIVWDGQEMIDLSAGADVAGSGAMSINDRGEVVGWIVPNGGAMHAARWAGGRTEYLTCEGYERSEALATNEAGHVVGWAEGAGTGYERNAMVWGGGAPIALDLYTQEGTPARWAKANDNNANGVVAGAVHRLDDPIAAVIWEPWAGSRTVLGTLGGSQSEAYAINDAGQVVGWALTADGDPHAFVWQAGTMIDLSSDDASGHD